MKQSIPKHVTLKEVDIWFQDEARVGQKGTLTRTWAKKGTRPRLTRQQQYEYAYIFGAVCPANNQAVGLVLPVANSAAMLAHLHEISKHVPPNRHAVLVLDQAAWHMSSKLNVFDNITLLALPPASPELNPVEQVWQTLRDNWLSNKCYDGYEAILDACCYAWNWLVQLPNKVRTLCSRTWAVL